MIQPGRVDLNFRKPGVSNTRRYLSRSIRRETERSYAAARKSRSYDALTDSGFDNNHHTESEGGSDLDAETCPLNQSHLDPGNSSLDSGSRTARHSDRVRLNVSGQKVECDPAILARHPTSLLGDPMKRRKLWDPTHREYFLDRHRPTFEAIFQFYQTGHLKRPIAVPLSTFTEELTHYEFSVDVINQFKLQEGLYIEKIPELPRNPGQRAAWLLMEYPDSSKAAKVMGIISLSFILLSIVSFCIETLPWYADSHCVNATIVVDGQTIYRLVPNYKDRFFIMESSCIVWFTIEFFIRLIVCPSKKRFFANILNIIDFITLIPYFVILSIVTISMSCEGAKGSASLLFLRVLRIFRVFKLSKHSSGLRVLGLTMKASLRELGLFLFFLIIGAIVFAGAIYYAEHGIEGSQIQSIPEGIWWAVVTMTTVGYGDVVPVGLWGKIIGTFCVVIGALTLALPAPVIVANFNHFYKRETGRGYSI